MLLISGKSHFSGMGINYTWCERHRTKETTSEVLQKLCLELDALSGDKLIDEEGASMTRMSPKHSCSLELL